MEKLTLEYLEQIVPYLPYELQMKAIEGTMIYTAKGINICSENWILIKDKNGFDCQIKNIKPILRPLSDLENNIDELFIEMGGGFKTTKHFKQHFINNILYSPYESLSYKTVIFLLKNHYDVFGLIEKNLAIDINTLK